MRRIIYNWFLCLMFLSFVSCESEDVGQHLKDTDNIILKLYTSAPASREVVADEPWEYALSHLDVFIFTDGNADNDKAKVHYERIETNAAPEGQVALSISRETFQENAKYWVYVIANSKEESSVFINVANLADLKTKIQEDPLLHLTATNAQGAPQYFLMDGIAGGESVVLNDGVAAKTTELTVQLRRAAAKVVVVLNKGANVTFVQNKEEGYYLRNLPTVTTLLAGAQLADGSQDLKTTTKTVSTYAEYTSDKVTITTYVYAHSWDEHELFTKGTSLILNIPLTYDQDLNDDTNTLTEHDNSYYQVELGKGREFLRNNYYLITGTINAPGATEDAQSKELDNLTYQVLDWTPQTLNVGGEVKPVYLKVNKDTLRIYNQNIDESLVFSSSSPIKSVTIHEEVTGEGENMLGTGNPYFLNKFGVETALTGRTHGNYNELVYGTTTEPVTITASSDTGLSGNITVNSTVPKNTAVRYFTLLIENEEGLKEKVLVEQYPVIYITNVLGWYSYRSDFRSSTAEPTTYEEGNHPYYNCAKWNNGWSYERKKRNDNDWSQPFFFSKVNTNTLTSGNNQGKSALYYYHYNTNSTLASDLVQYKKAEDSGNERGGNARMYHVHVTATSKDYTVGRPRLDNNGYPVNDADNARLVSPSFYIASQLGATQTPNTYQQAVTHCANYVETYKKVVYGADGKPVLDNNGNNTGATVHLDDWRLPTAAEVEIILKYQYGPEGTGTTPTVAMDEVLAGEHYYCVNPNNGNRVKNERQNDNLTDYTYVRCVRDAY